MFENRVLRMIFGPKSDDTTAECRGLHVEELHDLYSSPNIIRVIKSRRMRWAEHVARMGRREVYTGFWWGKLRERVHFKELGVDGGIILKWFLKSGMVLVDSIDLGQNRDRWPAPALCECHNDSPLPIKSGKYLDLGPVHLLRKDSVPCSEFNE